MCAAVACNWHVNCFKAATWQLVKSLRGSATARKVPLALPYRGILALHLDNCAALTNLPTLSCESLATKPAIPETDKGADRHLDCPAESRSRLCKTSNGRISKKWSCASAPFAPPGLMKKPSNPPTCWK